jgi:hypothetical protein
MRIIWWCIWSFFIFCLFIGCVPKDQKDQNEVPQQPKVMGVLTGVDFIPEDQSNVIVILKFEDGQVQKLRSKYSNPVHFQLGKVNVVVFDSWGTISKIEIKEPK